MDIFARIFSVNLLECPFTFRRRGLFVLVTLLPALFLLIEAGRSTIALTLAESGDSHALKEAVTIDPENPALEDRLGLDFLNDIDQTNASASLGHLRRAVEMSSDRAFYWADLASACESLSDFTCAGGALKRALKLAPMTPRLYWIAANYNLRRSQPEAALPLFRKLLELSPKYAWPTFSLCLRVLNSPDLIRQRVIPGDNNPSLRLSYVDFLIAQGQAELARQAWADAVQTGSRFPFSLAQPYLERLIDSGQVEQAMSAWQDLEGLGVIGRPHSGNLAYNGGFEQVPLNAGFDWRYQEAPYVAADFSAPNAYQGRRCLRLDFMGTNADFEPVFEWVPVAPQQRYLLTAEARSESISSDSGPRLRVVDTSRSAGLDVTSATTVGSTSWHPLRAEFTTGAQTRLLKLSVWRPHSRTFPTEITGHFWLDVVCLRAEGRNFIPPAPAPSR